MVCQHWAIFPARLQASIVASTELNFCVRNGNRWTLCGKNADWSGCARLLRFSPSWDVHTTYAVFHPMLGRGLCPLVHLRGLEPRTHWLRVSCSTNWAKGANLSAQLVSQHELKVHKYLSVLCFNFQSKIGKAEWEKETQTLRTLKEISLKEVQALGLLVSVSWIHYCTYTSDLSNS